MARLLSQQDKKKYGVTGKPSVSNQTYSRLKAGEDPATVVREQSQIESNQATQAEKPVIEQAALNDSDKALLTSGLQKLANFNEQKKVEPMMISSAKGQQQLQKTNQQAEAAVQDFQPRNNQNQQNQPLAVQAQSPQNLTRTSPSMTAQMPGGVQGSGLQFQVEAQSQYAQGLNDLDTEYANVVKEFSQMKRKSDSLSNDQLDVISETYALRKEEQREISDRAIKIMDLQGERLGTSRYSSVIQSQLVADEEREQHQELRRIDSEERQAAIQVEQARFNNDYSLMNSKMQTLSSLRQQRQGTIQNLYTMSQGISQEVRAQKQFLLQEEQSILNIQTAKADGLAAGLAAQMMSIEDPDDRDIIVQAAANANGVNASILRSSVETALVNRRASELGYRMDEQNLLTGELNYDMALNPEKYAQTERFTSNGSVLQYDPKTDTMTTLYEAPATGADFGDTFGARKEFFSQSKDFITVRDAYNKITASAENPSAAGDLALIFNYMKLLDPGSTVREGEFANAQNAAGVPERIRAQFNSITNGERLTPTTRTDFLTKSGELYGSAETSQKQLQAENKEFAEAFGLAGDYVAPDLTIGTQSLSPTNNGGASLDNYIEQYPDTKPETIYEIWQEANKEIGESYQSFNQGGDPNPNARTRGVERQQPITFNAKQVPYEPPVNKQISEPKNMVAAVAEMTGFEAPYMLAMAERESSFNPTASNPNSTAKGLYQFLDATWSETVKKHGSKYGITQSDRNKIGAQAIMAAEYGKDNARTVEANTGRTLQGGEHYIAHFLGAGGASTLLNNLGSESAASLMPEAAKSNPSVFYRNGKPLTTQQLYTSLVTDINKRAKKYT